VADKAIGKWVCMGKGREREKERKKEKKR